MSTTGFVNTDYSGWGPFAIAVFLALTFVGGCSGSTAGAIKVYRFQVLWLIARAYVRQLIEPRRVQVPLYDRRPLPAVALTTNQALLTAWSNDYRFDDVFARQIEGLGRAGDVAWGISTSGNSANVVNALRRARQLGLKTVGLTGAGGGAVAAECDVLMAVPGQRELLVRATRAAAERSRVLAKV